MQTTSTVPVNAKINTIQPIEGAKGNIALFYYQGKYPIYKSLDDNMYHLKSVMDAYKASMETDISKNLINDWVKLKKTTELVQYFLETGIPVSDVLSKKRQQRAQMQYLDGWYANEEAMLDFAGWLNVGFKIEIYRCFARQAEIDRLNADISHKQSTIDELNCKVDELLRINRDQSTKIDDMSYRLKKTYITVQSIADLPDKLTNNISSGNTIENVYIYTLPDECDNETMIIHLAARTDQSLKKLKSKLPNDHTIIDHFTIANAKDCIREIISEAESYGIVQEIRPTYAITITTDDMNTFKSAIDVILRKLNRSSKIVKRTVETTDKVNPYEYISKEWNINDAIINDIIKVHSITIDQLLSIVNGTLSYKRNGKEYTVKFCRKSPYLIYGRQIDDSIKWFGVKRGYFSDNA